MPTLWFPGNMPVQFLLLFTLIFLGSIALQTTLARRGLRGTSLWQAVLIWGTCDVLLKVVVFFRSLRRVVVHVSRLGHNYDARDANRSASLNLLLHMKPLEVLIHA